MTRVVFLLGGYLFALLTTSVHAQLDQVQLDQFRVENIQDVLEVLQADSAIELRESLLSPNQLVLLPEQTLDLAEAQNILNMYSTTVLSKLNVSADQIDWNPWYSDDATQKNVAGLAAVGAMPNLPGQETFIIRNDPRRGAPQIVKTLGPGQTLDDIRREGFFPILPEEHLVSVAIYTRSITNDQISYEQIGSGVRVSESYVLTAAHVARRLELDAQVKGSVWQGRNAGPKYGEPSSIVGVAFPPGANRFCSGRSAGDIVLLRVDFNGENANIARLDSLADIPERYVLVAGYGLTLEDYQVYRNFLSGIGNLSDIDFVNRSLAWAAIPLVSMRVANTHGIQWCNESEFVAGDLIRGFLGVADSCSGDSGGPVFRIGNDGKLSVTGLVSRGALDSHSEIVCGYGGIYTRISPYREWILETIDQI